VLRRGAQAHPEVRVAQFTTRFDLEQVGFYGLMKAYYGPGTRCDDPVLDWNRLMVSAMRDDRELLPNHRHYLAAGTYHTVLAGPASSTVNDQPGRRSTTGCRRWWAPTIGSAGCNGATWHAWAV
jgi:hypothetical protein